MSGCWLAMFVCPSPVLVWNVKQEQSMWERCLMTLFLTNNVCSEPPESHHTWQQAGNNPGKNMFLSYHSAFLFFKMSFIWSFVSKLNISTMTVYECLLNECLYPSLSKYYYIILYASVWVFTQGMQSSTNNFMGWIRVTCFYC